MMKLSKIIKNRIEIFISLFNHIYNRHLVADQLQGAYVNYPSISGRIGIINIFSKSVRIYLSEEGSNQNRGLVNAFR